MASTGLTEKKWWKEAVVYQIYPASFLDSKGNNGWGDIDGITSKLDYLKDLGVDIVWTSPIYRSPQADMGYDISDYQDIDPRYGTLESVDRLIAELKKRDMKLMMDLVVNHTSNQHDWFIQSRSSVQNPKRDWYIWKKPKLGQDGKPQPPNNWAQILGEANSAWTWDEKTGEYYLSLFTPEQPDLNWENPEVRAAVHDVLRFWLERGASGFRMDVINLISKVQSYPDAAVAVQGHTYQSGHKYFANGPRLHEYLKEIRQKVLDHYDTITVGEMPFVRDDDEILRVVGADRGELNQIFSFDLVDIDNVPGDFKFTLHQWDATDLKKVINRLQRLMIDKNGWNSIFCENHDQPRSVSRYTDDSDQNRELGAKLLCLMQTTLSGTLYIYQGEELGMRNFPANWPVSEYKDVEAINYWKKTETMYSNESEKLNHARHILQRKARDHARTPMQWDSSPNAGFCAASTQPWMRVNSDYPTVNAAAQTGNHQQGELSVHAFWKRALFYRSKHSDLLIYGDFELLDDGSKETVVYRRFNQSEQVVVVMNFSGNQTQYSLPEKINVRSWISGNYYATEPSQNLTGFIELKPWEGIIGDCLVSS